jgi:tetratricopeptide (TPR) repeat protein
MFREIEDIVETLKNAKERGKKCSVLIGAGCSVAAGIPSARGFVNIIKERYPRDYERADEKTYPKCMAQLSVDEQRSLIVEFVDKAKVNWGHIALAQLMKEGYVDRVLTTNFDPLIMRACSLVGLYPATYDLAVSQHFEPDKVPDRAIFHLHGQRTGFILLNSEKVLKEHSDKLAPIFEDAGRGRVWLVVGYSGESDPVFNHLASVDQFDNRLYWIGYNDSEPAAHVREQLLKENKYAFYTMGFDSDSFFVTLAQMLGCFPPEFVSKPFTYLGGLFSQMTAYTLPKTEAPVDALRNAHIVVQEAIEKIESLRSDALQASSDLLGGDYEKVVGLEAKYGNLWKREVEEPVAWAYIGKGNVLYNEAKSKSGMEKMELYKQASEKYEAALKIIPDSYQALNNWGNALSAQAKLKAGAKADELYGQAHAKYEAALEIEPEFYQAFNNWANALSAQAKMKTGAVADELYRQAGEKYEAALKIEPDIHQAFNNWGNALSAQAKIKSGAEADELYRQAGEKFEAATKIAPDFYQAFNNWGNALSAQAKLKNEAEADELYGQASEKYEMALKIKPDHYEAFNDWGSELESWARTKTGAAADDLFRQAGEKYVEAVKVMPDKRETIEDGGSTLILRHTVLLVNSKTKLLNQAKEALLKAEANKDGSFSYNLARVCALNSEGDECRQWLIKSKEQGDLPSREHLEKDPDFANLRDRKWFKDFLAGLP